MIMGGSKRMLKRKEMALVLATALLSCCLFGCSGGTPKEVAQSDTAPEQGPDLTISVRADDKLLTPVVQTTPDPAVEAEKKRAAEKERWRHLRRHRKPVAKPDPQTVTLDVKKPTPPPAPTDDGGDKPSSPPPDNSGSTTGGDGSGAGGGTTGTDGNGNPGDVNG
jgi:hypothetical protein